MINVQEVKEVILKYLDEQGPSLPIPVSKKTGISTIFASAILSELIHEKKVSTSNLRVGSSPLYLIPGQESKLENFADNLGGVEKETFLKLKESKVLQDELQTPARRVALRILKDFAKPFKADDRIFWKYAFITDEEAMSILNKTHLKTHPKPSVPEPRQIVQDKQAEPVHPKPKKIRQNNAKTNKFLEEVTNFLKDEGIELLFIQDFKKEITGRIKKNGVELFLYAFNKKRLNEKDIVKAYKKSLESGMNYYIISKGDLSKKTNDLIDALKNMENFARIAKT